MTEAFAGAAVHQQQFATPRLAIIAQADAVQRQADGGPVRAVLGQHRSDVGVMVLHGDGGHGPFRRQFRPVARAEEFRMQVVGDEPRLDVQHLPQMGHRLDHRLTGGGVVEIAHMLGNEGFVTAGQAHGVLEVAAQRQHRRTAAGELDGTRYVTPSTTNELLRWVIGGFGSHHRIITAHQDLAVVKEEGIGDAGEALQRHMVSDDQRLAAGVGAGHHQHQRLRLREPGEPVGPAGRLVEQQVLQRRMGQHHAQPGESRRHAVQLLVDDALLAQQHDGALRRREQDLCAAADIAPLRRRHRVGDHHREGLLLALLAVAQPRHRLGITRVTGEMEAAQALDGDDLAAQHARHRSGNRVYARHRHALRIEQHQAGAAIRTGVGLGVEAAMLRRLVLAQTGRALRERRHAGGGAVVGQRARQRVARAALGAVDEGVTVAPVRGVEKLRQAVGAHRRVVADGGVHGGIGTVALEDGKAVGVGLYRAAFLADLIHSRQGRRVAAQPLAQLGDGRGAPLDLDVHAGAVVAHPAGDAQFLRQAINEGPEAHALHHAAHADADADGPGLALGSRHQHAGSAISA